MLSKCITASTPSYLQAADVQGPRGLDACHTVIVIFCMTHREATV